MTAPVLSHERREDELARPDSIRHPSDWLRLLLGLILVFALFQWSAGALGSDRGQSGLIVGALVVASTIGVERILFGQPAFSVRSFRNGLGLGRPRAGAWSSRARSCFCLWGAIVAFARVTGAAMTLVPGWAGSCPAFSLREASPKRPSSAATSSLTCGADARSGEPQGSRCCRLSPSTCCSFSEACPGLLRSRPGFCWLCCRFRWRIFSSWAGTHRSGVRRSCTSSFRRPSRWWPCRLTTASAFPLVWMAASAAGAQARPARAVGRRTEYALRGAKHLGVAGLPCYFLSMTFGTTALQGACAATPGLRPRRS